MTSQIHPSAIIGDDVEIGAGCTIGPHAVIESGARIGEGNEIGAGCYLFGSLRMGARNRLMRGASLGGEPQSKGYRGEPTELIVGDGNWFGENTVVHRGTVARGRTVVGDGLYLMNHSHLGHDVQVGDHVTIAPGVNVGGEATIMDRANLGGGVAIHQHTRVGELVMAGGGTIITQDVVPFTIVAREGDLYGLNAIGIRRAEHLPNTLATLKAAYRRFCVRRESLEDVLAWLAEQPADPFVASWRAFLGAESRRGYTRARVRRRGGAAAQEDG